jgi:hypothetical protein
MYRYDNNTNHNDNSVIKRGVYTGNDEGYRKSTVVTVGLDYTGRIISIMIIITEVSGSFNTFLHVRNNGLDINSV